MQTPTQPQNLPQQPTEQLDPVQKKSPNLALVVGLTALITAALVGAAVFAWQKATSNQEITNLEQQLADTKELSRALPNVSPAVEDEILLKEVFAKNTILPANEISVSIRERVGEYASGNATLGNGPSSGGVWFGVKKDGAWQIAADGNGIPLCSELDAYSIPTELIDSCVGENGELQQRTTSSAPAKEVTVTDPAQVKNLAVGNIISGMKIASIEETGVDHGVYPELFGDQIIISFFAGEATVRGRYTSYADNATEPADIYNRSGKVLFVADESSNLPLSNVDWTSAKSHVLCFENNAHARTVFATGTSGEATVKINEIKVVFPVSEACLQANLVGKL